MQDFITDPIYKDDLVPTLLTNDVDRVTEFINNMMPGFLAHIHKVEDESVDRVVNMQINVRTHKVAIRQFNAVDIVSFFQENYPEVLEKANYEALFWAETIFKNIIYARLKVSMENDGSDIESFSKLRSYVRRAIEHLKDNRDFRIAQKREYKQLSQENPYYNGRAKKIRQTRKNGVVIKEQLHSDWIKPKQSHVNKHYLGSDIDYDELNFSKDLSEKIHLTYSAILGDDPDIEYNKELLDDLQELCELVIKGFYYGRPDGKK